MSKLLQEFYDECDEAINGIRPYWFSFDAGLCGNLIYFLYHKKIDTFLELKDELLHQFLNAKLDMLFPFNKDKLEFKHEINKYSNPLRVQWIKDHKTKVTLCGLPN